MAQKPTVRKPFIGGNWKCNGTVASVTKLCDDLSKVDTKGVDVMISPVFIHIPLAQSLLKSKNSNIIISSQNCSATERGAFTGEIACEQLIDIGVKHTIIGHSERREKYGETDAVVTKKISNALKNGLSVIACLGESLDERKSNKVEEVTSKQMTAIANGVNAKKKEDWKNIVIAYEPIWAIGTNVACTPDKAQETHQFLRKWIADNVSKEIAEQIRIIYGGSVKPGNCGELFQKPDIDGFLVGGASLEVDTFAPIIKSAQQKK